MPRTALPTAADAGVLPALHALECASARASVRRSSMTRCEFVELIVIPCVEEKNPLHKEV